jgi:riboflavin kinase/FMN adenylyltransferase
MHIVHDSAAEFARVLAQAHPTARSYVTVGVFDGVHRGHQQLVTSMVEAAHSTHNVAVAINFDPHPATALGYEPPPLLTTAEERAGLLAALGLDVLVVLPFTLATAHTPATAFVEAMMRDLHLAELWGGPDFALGYRREGDVPFLRRLGAECGFTVHIVAPLVWEGKVVSSSRVRAALRAGDIPQATGCLGRPYRLADTVVRGDGRGHDIGVPTANISPPPGRLIPSGGIYACLAHTEHLGMHPAVVNIGTRPTFARNGLVIEAHLLDFHGDLYGQVLALDFIARLRDERAFPTPDALVEQIHEDIVQARAILGSSRAADEAG